MWRENRGAGEEGMQSVANVVMNRVKQRGTDAYAECTRAEQFSSITAKGDPELNLWPSDGDAQWFAALLMAAEAAAGTLKDITNGATLFYAPHSVKPSKPYRWLDGTMVPFPASWNAAAVTPLCSIGGQLFFK